SARLAPAIARATAVAWSLSPSSMAGKMAFSDMAHPCKFRFFGWGEIEGGGAGEVLLRVVTRAGKSEGLTPFQMQPAPVGCIFLGFREFRQRQMRLVLGHQRLAPAFQGIGEVRALLVG